MFLVYKLLHLDHIYVTLKLRFISIKNKLSSFFLHFYSEKLFVREVACRFFAIFYN